LRIIRLYRIHEMQIIDADIPVFLSVRRLHSALCAKTAEQIEVLFAVKTPGEPRNTVLDGGPDPQRRGGSAFKAAFTKLLWPLVIHKTPVWPVWPSIHSS